MAVEKNEEKTKPEAAENQQDKSEPTAESKSEPKSEPNQEDVVKSLQGQISKLQRELNESKEQLAESSTLGQKIVKALSDTEDEEDIEVTPDAVLSEVQKLRQEIDLKNKELEKNSYIDSLSEIPEAQKIYLKNKIGVVDNLEDVVNSELEALNEVIQASTSRATDSRPKKVGNANIDITDARAILEHPEAFK